jgi:hypothetical protein
MTDDDTGWTEILVDGWGPLVRAAVVARVEEAFIGRRGVLVRALGDDPDVGGHAACIEEVHDRIIDAIRAETGADLDHLGSQAAWACYDEVWGALQVRWLRVGRLAPVLPHVEVEVVTLVRALTPTAAEHAGADIGALPYAPLRVADRPHVDVDGLLRYLGSGSAASSDRLLIERLLHLLGPG